MGTGGTVDYLRGDWNFERQITDRRGGRDGVFTGSARFLATSDGGLDYTETGELRIGTHRGAATRRLRYDRRPDGAADVRFADGREFYRLDLQSGRWEADHPCRADAYHVTVTRLGADAFSEIWLVAGADKDYELRTLYRRAHPGTAQPGTAEPGTAEPGTAEAGTGSRFTEGESASTSSGHQDEESSD